MEKTKHSIISVFKLKGCELSTNNLASTIYSEYSELEKSNNKDSKRKIAKFNRRLLHHINKLIDDGILRLSKHGEKGKKFYVLNIGDDEEITEISPKYKKRITITKPALPILPIEGYEEQGIVLKYQDSSWVERLNSIIILCNKIKNKDQLENAIQRTFSVVNDCICLENFEEIINNEKTEPLINFIEKLNSQCQDYGKLINCAVNISRIKKQNLIKILDKISSQKINKIIFIYVLDKTDFKENFNFLKSIVSAYIKNKKFIYIRNNQLLKAPAFIGSAGPYYFSEKEWKERRKNPFYACSQSSIIIDVNKFHSIYGLDIEKFSQLMINISKSFLSSNSIQRRKAGYYFREMFKIKGSDRRELLELSRNYIRLWNYGVSEPNIDQELVINMISEANKKMMEFARAEETIYNSCGMTTRFKLALSCASVTSSEKLTPPKYKKIEIKNIEDIYHSKIKKEILDREKISNLFEGGNEITFNKIGSNFDTESILRDISVIMDNLNFPLFSYNFKYIAGDMKLTSFFK